MFPLLTKRVPTFFLSCLTTNSISLFFKDIGPLTLASTLCITTPLWFKLRDWFRGLPARLEQNGKCPRIGYPVVGHYAHFCRLVKGF